MNKGRLRGWFGAGWPVFTLSAISLISACATQGGAQSVSRAPPALLAALPSQCTNNSINAPADFAKGVYMLPAFNAQTGFNFINNGFGGDGNYDPPVALSGQNLGSLAGTAANPVTPYSTYQADLTAAFSVAPPYLQAALCTLVVQKELFIEPDDHPSPFAWSFWANGSTQNNGAGRFLGVNATLWKSGANLAKVENLILNHLLGDDVTTKYAINVAVTVPQAAPTEQTGATTGSPTNVALMTILAREVGLMTYHDYVDPNSGVTSAGPICSNNTKLFQSYSWKLTTGTGGFATPGHIQSLGEEVQSVPFANAGYIKPSLMRQVTNILSTTDQFNFLSSQFTNVYYGKGGTSMAPLSEWADLLAETTPYDDFSETFRLQALIDSKAVTSIKFQVNDVSGGNGTPVNIDVLARMGDGKGTILDQKIACISGHNTGGDWASP